MGNSDLHKQVVFVFAEDQKTKHHNSNNHRVIYRNMSSIVMVTEYIE